MSLTTEFEKVSPDIPRELLPESDPRKITLDMVKGASGNKSKEVTVVGTQLTQRLREVIQLAGTRIDDSDSMQMHLFYRRGNLYPYRFEARWEIPHPDQIARLSILPLIYSFYRGQETHFEGISFRCYNPKNSLVTPWTGHDKTSLQDEAGERARLMMELGISKKGLSHEYYQLALIQDIASVF